MISVYPKTPRYQISSHSDDFRQNQVHLAKLCQIEPAESQDIIACKNQGQKRDQRARKPICTKFHCDWTTLGKIRLVWLSFARSSLM